MMEAAVNDDGRATDAAQRRSYTFFLSSLLENAREMDVQLDANEEDEDRAKRGKDDTGGMKSSGRRRKHVGNSSADDRPDDAEHDCPENRHGHVQYRFRDKARDQPNNNVPD